MGKVKEKILEDTKKRINDTKKKINNARKKIESIEYDAHWYRRVFHSFGASLLFYYMLPNEDWIHILKFWIPLIIVLIIIFIEILRIKGKISSDHFFGLRFYEKNRVGSYVFFAVAIFLLLRFFPQHIAIPCILCASVGDPIIGEIRHRYGMQYVYFLGFLICMLFFIISWYKEAPGIMIIVAVVGGIGAIIGETKKFWWLDDDFMIQIIPALLIGIIWLALPIFGLSQPTDLIINPAIWSFG
jgi:dolichol kinase